MEHSFSCTVVAFQSIIIPRGPRKSTPPVEGIRTTRRKIESGSRAKVCLQVCAHSELGMELSFLLLLHTSITREAREMMAEMKALLLAIYERTVYCEKIILIAIRLIVKTV